MSVMHQFLSSTGKEEDNKSTSWNFLCSYIDTIKFIVMQGARSKLTIREKALAIHED